MISPEGQQFHESLASLAFSSSFSFGWPPKARGRRWVKVQSRGQ